MSAKNTPENFWSKVKKGEPDECWEWQGAKTSGGYGNLSWSGARVQAHRVAYFLHYGGIRLCTGFRLKGVAKAYKEFVLHKCDNRACCNPKHLFLGSMAENQLDAYSKKRKAQPRSKHANAKLTAEQVREIRRRYAAGGVSQEALGKEFGTHQASVSQLIRLTKYKDIT